SAVSRSDCPTKVSKSRTSILLPVCTAQPSGANRISSATTLPSNIVVSSASISSSAARETADTKTRQWIGEDRPVEPLGQARNRAGRIRRWRGRTGYYQTSIAAADHRGERADRIGRQTRARGINSRVRRARFIRREFAFAFTFAFTDACKPLAFLAHVDKRFPHRQVQMPRSGRHFRRGGKRAASDSAVIAVEVEARGGRGEIDAPSRVTTEHPDLVDGLCGAAIARLGRTVGGDDDERNLRQGSLDDRGHVVGRGGARRAYEDDGAAGLTRDPERKESGAAFVEDHPWPDCGRTQDAGDECGRAGAR